jgi:hypothetical protein
MLRALLVRGGDHAGGQHAGRAVAHKQGVIRAGTEVGTPAAARAGFFRNGWAVADTRPHSVQTGLVLAAAVAGQGGAVDIDGYLALARRGVWLGTLRCVVKQVAAVTLEATRGATAARTRHRRSSSLLWTILHDSRHGRRCRVFRFRDRTPFSYRVSGPAVGPADAPSRQQNAGDQQQCRARHGHFLPVISHGGNRHSGRHPQARTHGNQHRQFPNSRKKTIR